VQAIPLLYGEGGPLFEGEEERGFFSKSPDSTLNQLKQNHSRLHCEGVGVVELPLPTNSYTPISRWRVRERNSTEAIRVAGEGFEICPTQT